MKILTLPDNYMDLIRAELLKQVDDLLAKPITDKNVSLKASLPALLSTAVSKDVPDQLIHFTAEAYCKLLCLTQEHKEEVAANCLVFRDPEDVNDYTVYDVKVYPQTITAATVQSTDDYGLWLQTLSDEDFADCKMQYHSHVNMSVKPSAVDENFYTDMVPMINDFYIFMIFNKRGETWFNIYDKTRNMIFEDADITMDILDNDNNNIYAWVEESSKLITAKVYTPVTYVKPIVPAAATAPDKVKGKPGRPRKDAVGEYEARVLTVAERKQLDLADKELHDYWYGKGYNYADNY